MLLMLLLQVEHQGLQGLLVLRATEAWLDSWLQLLHPRLLLLLLHLLLLPRLVCC